MPKYTHHPPDDKIILPSVFYFCLLQEGEFPVLHQNSQRVQVAVSSGTGIDSRDRDRDCTV